MIIDIKDIFGKVHYFITTAICSVDEVDVPIKGEVDPSTGKDKTVNCWQVTLINAEKFYIDEETRRTFIMPEQPNQQNQSEQSELQAATIADLHTVQPSEVIEILDNEENQLVEVGV